MASKKRIHHIMWEQFSESLWENRMKRYIYFGAKKKFANPVSFFVTSVPVTCRRSLVLVAHSLLGVRSGKPSVRQNCSRTALQYSYLAGCGSKSSTVKYSLGLPSVSVCGLRDGYAMLCFLNIEWEQSRSRAPPAKQCYFYGILCRLWRERSSRYSPAG